MNKVWKIVALVGNVSEILIATTMVADLFNKIRGNHKATSITNVVEDPTPQPEQPYLGEFASEVRFQVGLEGTL